ncbi:hypothetical protein RFI_35785, partial [Reticulomyxa filosa]
IKIKYDFQIQMPRENTQEIIVLKQSKERSSVLLRLLLQTARERDVLCTILNALINKKKEMRQARLQLKDVVRLEIYPVGSSLADRQIDDSHAIASAAVATEEKKMIKDKQKKLELAQEQMNQLKMENTQLTEEKRIWKNEKDKLYEVGKMKTEQINKLTKDLKELTEQFQKVIKERDIAKVQKNIHICNVYAYGYM